MSNEKAPITAEEFVREKIRERNEIEGQMKALYQYQVTGEDALRWSHEFKELHLTTVTVERDRVRDLLSEAKTQIEYLHTKFKETGSGNAVLAQITEALSQSEKGAEGNG